MVSYMKRVHKLALSLQCDIPIRAGQGLSLCAPSLQLSYYYLSFLTLQQQTLSRLFGNHMTLTLADRPTRVVAQATGSIEGFLF